MAFVAAVPAAVAFAEGIMEFIGLATTVFEVAGTVDAVGGVVAAGVSEAAVASGGGVLTKRLAQTVARRAVEEASELAAEKAAGAAVKEGSKFAIKATARKVSSKAARSSIRKALRKLILKFGMGSLGGVLYFALAVVTFVITLLSGRKVFNGVRAIGGRLRRLGLRWKCVGDAAPKNGIPLKHKALRKALGQGKTAFSRGEWREFHISDLTAAHYIKVGRNYFQPDAWAWLKREKRSLHKRLSKASSSARLKADAIRALEAEESTDPPSPPAPSHSPPTCAIPPPPIDLQTDVITRMFDKKPRPLFAVKKKIMSLARKDERIRGGMLRLTAPPSSDHSIAFTICNGSMIICNWDDCQSVGLADEYAIDEQFRSHKVDKFTLVKEESSAPTAAWSARAPDDEESWCSKRPLDQCHATCFAAATLLLLSKLEYLHRAFKLSSRQYIDSIRSCSRLTEDMCSKIPGEVLAAYKEFQPSGFSMKGGGNATYMLLAMLRANQIPHRHLIRWDDGAEQSDVYPVPGCPNLTLTHFKLHNDNGWLRI